MPNVQSDLSLHKLELLISVQNFDIDSLWKQYWLLILTSLIRTPDPEEDDYPFTIG